MVTSERFELNRADVSKLVKGGLIAAAGCVLAIVADRLNLIDFSTRPTWGPILGAMLASLVNALRKFTGETR